MKKFFKAFLAVALCFSLCACGGAKKTQSTVLTLGDESYLVETKITAEGDVVKQMVQTSTINLTDFDEETIQTLSDSLDSYAEIYAEYESVKYSSDITDKEFVEVIDIDLTNKKELNALIDAGLLPISGDEEEIDYISYDLTVEALKEMGFEEKAK